MRDKLIDETYKEYDRFSRYQTTPCFYNTSTQQNQCGVSNWLKNDTTYSLHFVKKDETIDMIALYYYNNPTYYWIIADFNRIVDPFVQLEEGQQLKIPVFSNVVFEEG